MHSSLWWLVLATCSFVSLAVYVPNLDEDDGVGEMISRIKRHSSDEIHGYSLAVMHAEDPDTGLMHRLTKRDVLFHANHPSAASRHFTLQMSSGNTMHMALSRRTITVPGTTIIERLSDDQNVHHQIPEDCFFAGPLKDGSGHAVLSLCEGEMMGAVEGEGHRYEIHTLPTEIAERHRRSTKSSAEPVLVTWSKFLFRPQTVQTEAQANSTTSFGDDDDELDIPNDDDDGDDDVDDDDDDDDSKEDDHSPALRYTICSETRVRRSALGDRFELSDNPTQRNRADRSPIVEVAAIMDADYTKTMTERTKDNTTAWLIRLAVTKWSGAAAVYGDPLWGLNITIRLVHLQIWRKNPTWYREGKMGARLLDVINNSGDLVADHIALWTYGCESNGANGLTRMNGVCRRPRGSVQFSAHPGYMVEMHELGHNLGLPHEWNIKECKNTKRQGFMSYAASYYAIPCYAKILQRTLPNKSCLYKESYKAKGTPTRNKVTGAQILGFDGQCEFKHGKGFQYFHSEENQNICENFPCIAINASATKEGILLWRKSLPGAICGHDKYCLRGKCLPRTDSPWIGVPRENTIVDGGWGPWSAPSECSTSTVGASSIRFSKRECNSPEPMNGAYCVGNVYKAELCSAQAPVSNVNIESLKMNICYDELRNDPSCSSIRKMKKIKKTKLHDMGSCSVLCKVRGQRTTRGLGFLLPDGVPCEESGYEAAKGIRKLCVQGRCMAFGCNGKTMGDGGGMTIDRCGVCGGSGSSCAN